MATLDWIVIGIYFLMLVGVVLLARRAKTMDDYAVGSRQIPGGIVFATLCATYIGPGYSMGIADRAAGAGYVWFFIFLAFSAQTLLVGFFIAPRLRQFENAYTVGDIMGYRYGKLVKFITGIIAVPLCAGFVGAIANASGNIINQFTGLPFGIAVALSVGFVIVYSTFGGIRTDILMDSIQFVVIAIIVPLILVFMLFQEGAVESVARIPESTLSLSGHFPLYTLLGMMLGFFLGESLVPPYVNRALVAKDSGQAKKGFLLAGAFSIAWFFVCASIGVLEAANTGEVNNAYLTAMQKYLPIGMLGMAVATMISIIISSQDSILNAAGVTLNNDILALISPRFKQPDTALRTSRIFNITIGILATTFAVNVPGVVDALLYCYTLWAPTIVLPLVIAVLKKNAHPYAGFAAILAGGISTAIWEWGLGNPYEVPSLLVGVIINQVVFWTVHNIFKNTSVTNGLLKPMASES